MEKRVVIAYIGNGKSANRYHLPFVLTRPEKFRVKTIFQRTLRPTMWEHLPGVNYTDKLNEILLDPEIDVVVVTTPTQAHYETACKVLKAGKHCIIEKPFATSVEEAVDLFQLASENNVIVECYQNRRFDSDFVTVQKVIESGRLGELFEVNMHYDYYRAHIPEGEAEYSRSNAFLYTHACHTVDQVISYFGIPQEVRSDVRQLMGNGRMNDYFDLDFFYEGFKVSVKSSYFRAKQRPSFEVYGKLGVFIKEEQDQQEADLKKFYLPVGHADFGMDKPSQYGTLTCYDEAGNYHEEKVVSERGDYTYYYDALYETVLNGAAPLVMEEQTMVQMKILAEAEKMLFK